MDGNGNHLEGRRFARAAALFVFAVSFILIFAVNANALVITAPVSVLEGQPVTVAASGAGQLTILRDGTAVASGTASVSDTMQTNSSSAGIVNYLFTSDSGQNDTRSVEIIDVPLALNISSPGSDASANPVAFTLTTNWEPEMCYVNIDGISHTLTEIALKSFNGSLTVSDGVHTVDYKCKLGNEIATVTRTLHVDTTPPKITGVSPSGDVTGPYVTLTLDTDEIAQCRYGTADAQFDALPNIFSQTYASRNTITLEETQQGPYTYFVRCQDVSGNKMATSTIISFVNKLPPIASITVDGKQPFKAGTYALSLTTNVPLTSIPTLTYSLQPTGKTQQIALTGSDAQWTGYLIIPPDTPDTVVSFSFSGMSKDNVAGSQISDGSLFTLAGMPPKAVDSITVENDTSYIKLKWVMTGVTGTLTYNIYRADHEGVTYADYYANTPLTEYSDSTVQGSRYYYYRVAPVDQAGNVGELSMEVYGSIVDEQLKQPTAVGNLVLQARLDEEIATMNAALLDANATIAKLEADPNQINARIIKDMGLVQQAEDAFKSIDDSLSSLRDMRQGTPAADDVDTAITQARTTLSDARKKLITNIVPLGQTETTQVNDAAGLERSLPYVLVGQNLSASDRDAYLKNATLLQDKLTVSIYGSTFTLYDANAGQQSYTYVSKLVKMQDPQNDITIVESIPKTVAQSVADIVFSSPPVILQSDPVVSYKYPVLEQQEYSYYVKSIVSLEDVKLSKTFAYPAVPPPGQSKPADLATGFATRVDFPFIPSTDYLLIFVGVVIILALGAYYVSLTTDKPFKGLPRPRAAQPVRQAAPLKPPALKPAVLPKAVRQRIVNAPLKALPCVSDAPKEQSSESVETLMQNAESAIDEKNYDRAMALYRDALSHLEKDTDLARILNKKTNQVYAKLLLFKRVADANAALRAKDVASLRSLLEEIRVLAAQVGEEDTTLIHEAKSSYAGLIRALNTLEIEFAEKY